MDAYDAFLQTEALVEQLVAGLAFVKLVDAATGEHSGYVFRHPIGCFTKAIDRALIVKVPVPSRRDGRCRVRCAVRRIQMLNSQKANR